MCTTEIDAVEWCFACNVVVFINFIKWYFERNKLFNRIVKLLLWPRECLSSAVTEYSEILCDTYHSTSSVVVQVHQGFYISSFFSRIHELSCKLCAITDVVTASTPCISWSFSSHRGVTATRSQFSHAARCRNCLCHSRRNNGMHKGGLSKSCKLINYNTRYESIISVCRDQGRNEKPEMVRCSAGEDLDKD